jgi:hypothetical protein
MNLKQIYQLAKNCGNYTHFENLIAREVFNLPLSADTSELTDSLRLTSPNQVTDAIEFAATGQLVKGIE